MVHPLVSQLRFTRAEWQRAFANLSPEDAIKQIGSTNCLSWMIGHLAFHEHIVWGVMGQGLEIAEDASRFQGGKAATTPPLDEVWAIWQRITVESDVYLNQLTQADMQERLQWEGVPERDDIGTMIFHNVYHYWYHLGESQMVRQMLGHTNLTEFVTAMTGEYAYRPENSEGD